MKTIGLSRFLSRKRGNVKKKNDLIRTNGFLALYFWPWITNTSMITDRQDSKITVIYRVVQKKTPVWKTLQNMA